MVWAYDSFVTLAPGSSMCSEQVRFSSESAWQSSVPWEKRDGGLKQGLCFFFSFFFLLAVFFPFLCTTVGYCCEQDIFRQPHTDTQKPTPCRNANFEISLCLTVFRSFKGKLWKVKTGWARSKRMVSVIFFFSSLSIVLNVLNYIALIFPAHVRWEAVHMSRPVAPHFPAVSEGK